MASTLHNLSALLPTGDEGLTFRELCRLWGVGERVGKNYLRAADEAGMLVRGQKIITNVAGRPSAVPVYSFVEKPKKGRGK